MNRNETINQLISRAHGLEYCKKYNDYNTFDQTIVKDAIEGLLEMVPITKGSCALMSAALGAFLNDQHNIPAIVVAGSLIIENKMIFEYKKPIPVATKCNPIFSGKWDGHCWVEFSGYILDVSIFRTAYSISRPSVLKEFVYRTFGADRGALVSPPKDLEDRGMKYIPKSILRESQIAGLLGGLEYQIKKQEQQIFKPA